jgi:hypothetical protein
VLVLDPLVAIEARGVVSSEAGQVNSTGWYCRNVLGAVIKYGISIMRHGRKEGGEVAEKWFMRAKGVRAPNAMDNLTERRGSLAINSRKNERKESYHE